MNYSNAKPVVILMAEDDPDDRMIAQEAFLEAHIANELYFVEDGIQLLDYLNNRGNFKDPSKAPKPGIILLDLNMPRLDGREALKEIKKDPALRRIPVVVLTTSKSEEDIFRTYDLGASSFITKPVTFEGLVQIIKMLESYWFEIVILANK